MQSQLPLQAKAADEQQSSTTQDASANSRLALQNVAPNVSSTVPSTSGAPVSKEPAPTDAKPGRKKIDVHELARRATPRVNSELSGPTPLFNERGRGLPPDTDDPEEQSPHKKQPERAKPLFPRNTRP